MFLLHIAEEGFAAVWHDLQSAGHSQLVDAVPALLAAGGLETPILLSPGLSFGNSPNVLLRGFLEKKEIVRIIFCRRQKSDRLLETLGEREHRKLL
jgi:hypothetical protein